MFQDGLPSSGFVWQSNGMTTREEAAEQLRVIRSMMERATIFRALSGETALVGGAAALGAAWITENRQGMAWAGWWLAGLAFVIAFNIFQLIRLGSAHQRPFWSSGLRLALRGALPPIIAGGFLGVLFIRSGQVPAAASMWIIHYGLALLAIREFAPRSMVFLGWSFVAFGLVALSIVAQVIDLPGQWSQHINPSRLMALAFGGFHLIYGALIVTTKSRDEAVA
jgi:hypothetical protein